MNKQQDFDTTIRVPVVTDIVRPGDPDIIKRAKSGQSSESQQNFEKRLKERIAELQSAAGGEGGYTGLARAHAIRSERGLDEGDKNAAETPEHAHPINTDYEQQIDKRRNEIIRELSTMLK